MDYRINHAKDLWFGFHPIDEITGEEWVDKLSIYIPPPELQNTIFFKV